MTEENCLVEGLDYYYNKEGYTVLTEAYHLKRGRCCQSGCIHCPYEFSEKTDPSIPSELQESWTKQEELEVYDGEIDESL